MTHTPSLLIHAGMRPGDLIIAHADGTQPVFVPCSERVHRFEIGKNTQAEEWALLRRYVSGGEPDALMTFHSEQEANQALEELHKALLEPAPLPVMESKTGNRWIPMMLVVLIVSIGSLAYCSKHSSNHPVAPIESKIPTDYAPSGQYSDPSVSSPPAGNPNSSGASPGDIILQQIQRPSSTGDTNKPPQDTPASAPNVETPGDAMLQQIQGR